MGTNFHFGLLFYSFYQQARLRTRKRLWGGGVAAGKCFLNNSVRFYLLVHLCSTTFPDFRLKKNLQIGWISSELSRSSTPLPNRHFWPSFAVEAYSEVRGESDTMIMNKYIISIIVKPSVWIRLGGIPVESLFRENVTFCRWEGMCFSWLIELSMLTVSK